MNKRERIFTSALQLFVEQGFHATPTSQIAVKAGVATGTLFHYFKTKEDLINALYLNTKSNYIVFVTENFNEQDSLYERIKNLWMRTLDWTRAFPFEFQFIQQFSVSAYITRYTRDQVSDHMKFMKSQLEEGVTQNKLKSIPLDLLLQIIASQIFSLSYYLQDHPELWNDQNLIESIYLSCWDAIRVIE